MSEIAWAAGLFEGEGYLSLSGGVRPYAGLNMTDEDVVRRFHEVIGVGSVTGPHHGAKKPRWTWRTTSYATFIVFADLVSGHLGIRRSARLAELLDFKPARPRREPGFHCSQPVTASGAGYAMHRYRGEAPCARCLASSALYAKGLRARNR